MLQIILFTLLFSFSSDFNGSKTTEITELHLRGGEIIIANEIGRKGKDHRLVKTIRVPQGELNSHLRFKRISEIKTGSRVMVKNINVEVLFTNGISKNFVVYDEEIIVRTQTGEFKVPLREIEIIKFSHL